MHSGSPYSLWLLLHICHDTHTATHTHLAGERSCRLVLPIATQASKEPIVFFRPRGQALFTAYTRHQLNPKMPHKQGDPPTTPPSRTRGLQCPCRPPQPLPAPSDGRPRDRVRQRHHRLASLAGGLRGCALRGRVIGLRAVGGMGLLEAVAALPRRPHHAIMALHLRQEHNSSPGH
jgi:hypothetical protein